MLPQTTVVGEREEGGREVSVEDHNLPEQEQPSR
jgi:hypothetical protein